MTDICGNVIDPVASVAADAWNWTLAPDGTNSSLIAGEGVKTVPVGLQVMATTLTSVASFFSCAGVNMQKWAHTVEQNKPQGERKPLVKCWRWWAGILTMIFASCGDIGALPFIPLSRVAALGSLAIVANVAICPLFLGEKVTRNDMIGAVLTVSGTGLACLFGVGEEPVLDTDCMLRLFAADMFIAFFMVCLISLLILMWAMEGFRRTKNRVLGCELEGCTAFECLSVWQNKKLMDQLPTTVDNHFRFFKGFGPQFYPAIIAIFGGVSGAQSVTLSKAVLMFLRNAASGDEVGRSVGLLFGFLVPMGIFLYGQIRYLNEALASYRDSLFVLPIYQSTWILMGIASGLIFYQEYRSLEVLNACLFTLGIAISLAGVQVLTARKAAPAATAKGPAATDSEMSVQGDGTSSVSSSVVQRQGSGRRRRSTFVAPAVERELTQSRLGRHQDYHPPQPEMLVDGVPVVRSDTQTTGKPRRARGVSLAVWPPPEEHVEKTHVPSIAVKFGGLRLRSTSVLMTEGTLGSFIREPNPADGEGLATSLLGARQESPRRVDAEQTKRPGKQEQRERAGSGPAGDTGSSPPKDESAVMAC